VVWRNGIAICDEQKLDPRKSVARRNNGNDVALAVRKRTLKCRESRDRKENGNTP